MATFRLSLRGMIVAIAVIGFDGAAMARAFRLGKAAHAVKDYTIGFGLVLLVLNLLILGLYGYFARRAELPRAERLKTPPSPLVMFGLYVAVLALAILSVLFITSGRF